MEKIKELFSNILLLFIIFTANTFAQDEGACDSCIWQYNANQGQLYQQKAWAIAWQCTPVFGTENEAGLSDVYDYATEGAGGVGAIFTGLDMAFDFWGCVNDIEQEYYRGLDALVGNMENCFRYSGCHYTGWGYWKQSQNNTK